MSNSNKYHIDEHCLIVTESKDNTENNWLLNLICSIYYVESRSVVRYMESWQPYTNAATVRLRTLVKNINKNSAHNLDQLTNLIESLGTDTREITFAEDNTHFNYTSWQSILPRVIESITQIIAQYEHVLSSLNFFTTTNNNQNEKIPEHITEIIKTLTTIKQTYQQNLDNLCEWQQRISA